MSDEKKKTLHDLKLLIRSFVDERDWAKYHRPLALAISVSIETGELLELFQWISDEEVTKQLQKGEFREKLSDELADIMIYLIRLADVVEIDIASAIISKLEKNRRKYPPERWRGKIPEKINLR